MTPELEALLLQELRRTWHTFNHSYFHQALKPPVFLLGDTDSRLGSWEPTKRWMTVSVKLAREQPWGIVCEVLKHEMAHQYAHEVLGARSETAHGPAFRHVCERLGIDAASKGLPAEAGVDEGQARVVRRVQKLLALAGSPNAHEAEAAANAARRLMLEHNLQAPAGRSWGFRHLGPVQQRIPEHHRFLSTILTTHFFVESIWVNSYDVDRGVSGRVLEICGTPGNLEFAAYVYDFLLGAADRLWEEHHRVLRGGERDRQHYLAGVMRGFWEKLQAGAEKNREEGLVWVGDPGAKALLDQRYPRTQKLRPSTATRRLSFHAGREAGRDLVLNKPVTGGGTGGPKGFLGG